MKSKHSEGPWIVKGATIYSAPEDAPVAHVEAGRRIGWVTATVKANTRLIAAAPAGYALALHIHAMADDAYLLKHPEWVKLVAEARDLIDAAEEI